MIIFAAVGYATITTNGGFPGQSKAFAAPVTGLSLPAVSANVAPVERDVVRPAAINRTTRIEQPISPQLKTEARELTALAATPTVSAQEGAAVQASMVVEEADLPPYQVYTVQEGDNVSTIASRFGIEPTYILANNAEIHDSDTLSLGQSLLIPAGNGILHEVRLGETLSDIADRYQVDVNAILEFRSNDIASVDAIVEAQLLFVPGAQPLPVAAPEAVPAPEAGDGASVDPDPSPSPDDSGSDSGGSAPSSGGIVGGGPSSSAGLIWPLSGPISSYYGAGHPLGIDIDAFNLAGAAVASATSGTVVFAGGNACCSYGLYVVVVSPSGIETLYAHLSSISVSQGQVVSQGEALGVVGSTGYSTGRHLHFEVIDNGVRVNPLSYLP